MADVLEIRIEQRKRLYQLLRIKKLLHPQNIMEIEVMINATEAEMEEEDVAWVEKKVAQLP